MFDLGQILTLNNQIGKHYSHYGGEMPAEKLTKKRLIQIVVMLIILVVAFIYRTYTHSSF